MRIPRGGDEFDGQLDDRRRRGRNEAQAAQVALSHVCAQEQKQTLLTFLCRDTFFFRAISKNLIFIYYSLGTVFSTVLWRGACLPPHLLDKGLFRVVELLPICYLCIELKHEQKKTIRYFVQVTHT